MRYYRIKWVKNGENVKAKDLTYKLKSISVPISCPPGDCILKKKWCLSQVAQLVRAS